MGGHRGGGYNVEVGRGRPDLWRDDVKKGHLSDVTF